MTVNLPSVSIIIVVFNQLKYTKQCIDSLYDTLQLNNNNIEIIVVDNNSTDGTGSYLQTLPKQHFKVLTNQENLGYARAANQGASIAAGQYLVFINNDIIALSGWLEEMVKVMEVQDNVGLVSSKLLYPNNTIQHAGMGMYMVNNQSLPLDYYFMFQGKPSNLPAANIMRDCLCVIGACVLTPKKIFDQVRGWDENYWVGHEDLDLCLKVRQKGYRVVYCPRSVLYHFTSVSEARHIRDHENIRYFHEKWLGKFKPDIKPSTDSLTSIIIPCFNLIKYTKLCIDSIYKYTYEPFEIILINAVSTNETESYLKQLTRQYGNVKVISGKQNLDLAAACNLGIKAASGENILIMHNDVVVTAYWLTRMLAIEKSFGIMGPVSNAAAGLQQVKDIPYIDKPGMHKFAREIGESFASKMIETNRVLDFCMLINKEVIDHIGGFDSQLGLLAFDDFCMRTRLSGYKILLRKDVFVHHFGKRHLTRAKINQTRLMEDSWESFEKKWNIPRERLLEEGYDPSYLKKFVFYCPIQ